MVLLTANSTGFVCYIRIENPAKNDPDPLPQGVYGRWEEWSSKFCKEWSTKAEIAGNMKCREFWVLKTENRAWVAGNMPYNKSKSFSEYTHHPALMPSYFQAVRWPLLNPGILLPDSQWGGQVIGVTLLQDNSVSITSSWTVVTCSMQDSYGYGY